MQIKECYVSHNGISCFTNINTLVDIKNINLKSIINNNKNNFLFYITLRVSEFVINDFIKNKIYLFDNKFKDTIFESISFS
uniref:Uncharacterized protein n=1 Tax=viral metagenome TaxID=1070528 RepID=A0A6C0AZQ7_9ZZZZ|tara:strand:- start:651 stop:893 length:243 start_codon:yes stop_codon:yes gene_type:complete